LPTTRSLDRAAQARARVLAGRDGLAAAQLLNDAYKRAGYVDVATEVQRLWLDGKREEAATRVPDELVLKTNLLGTEKMVRERLVKYREAGITTLRVEPAADDIETRMSTLGRLMDLVREL
jgi:Luciferase-like monooxygenase